jgi:hypothetical protein
VSALLTRLGAVHHALPARLEGRPSHHNERREWLLYAFDPTKRPRVGIRSRDSTAVAPTEDSVLREMARCLREISVERAPK